MTTTVETTAAQSAINHIYPILPYTRILKQNTTQTANQRVEGAEDRRKTTATAIIP